MMLGRMSRKARPVVREKSGEDSPLWRLFDPGFEGKVEVLACADDEDGFNVTIRDNFWVPAEAALAVELPQGKGSLGALEDPDGIGFPKQRMEKHGDKKLRMKKPHEPVVIPPLVSQVAGGGAAAGGSSAGSKPAGERKRKVDTAGAGERKRSKLRTTQTAAIPQPKPTGLTGRLTICVQVFVIFSL
ncbi:hypothetical protein Hanom_Chr01g00017081 [Helianthus anomalus]